MLPLLALLTLQAPTCLPHDTLPARLTTPLSAPAAVARLEATFRREGGAAERLEDSHRGWSVTRVSTSADERVSWTLEGVVEEGTPTLVTLTLHVTREDSTGRRTVMVPTRPVHPDGRLLWCVAQQAAAALQSAPAAAAADTVFVESLPPLPAPRPLGTPSRAWRVLAFGSVNGPTVGTVQLGWTHRTLGLVAEGGLGLRPAAGHLPHAAQRVTPLTASLTLGHASEGVTRHWAHAGGGVSLQPVRGIWVVGTAGYAWDRARRIFVDPSRRISPVGRYTTPAFDADAARGTYVSGSAQIALGRFLVAARTTSRPAQHSVGLGWRW